MQKAIQVENIESKSQRNIRIFFKSGLLIKTKYKTVKQRIILKGIKYIKIIQYIFFLIYLFKHFAKATKS